MIMTVLGLAVAVIVAVAIVWILNSGQDDDALMEESSPTYDMLMEHTDSDTETTARFARSYYLSYDGTRVTIYREPEREFYDYADINMEVLPPETVEQLKLGMYIDGEDNLYDFLQTYSS
jgi:nitrogen fixation-related uncharacterized protein